LLLAIALCFASNRDIFSPAKFYHAFLLVFFADVFLSEQNGYVYAVYLGFIFTGMSISLLEAYTLPKQGKALIRREPCRRVPARFVFVLWALSIIPILAQCYLIHITGGLSVLAASISRRVGVWRGLGPLLFLIRLMTPINLVYFTVGLVYEKRHPHLWWFLYVLHLILAVFSAALMGGRSGILARFLLMMMIYNYLRRPVKLRYALIGGATLLVVAAFLGTVRNNLTRLDRIDRISDMRGDALNLRMLSYGVNPLNLVFEREFTDYQYGKTFLTALTNFVPRRVWPGKWAPGRVVLTEFRDGPCYTGLTHTNTGIVVEGIINFGYPLGIGCAFVFLGAVTLLSVQFYVNFLNSIHQRRGLSLLYLVLLYSLLAPVAGSLLYGEFTNLVGNVLTTILLVSVVTLFLRLRFVTYCILSEERMAHDKWC